ncbi:MAG: alpha/beta hydrolase [Deltaproteobacteria bacterium]|nr:alpha/beta hydrolase [Deltaproteobacteria bacterium]
MQSRFLFLLLAGLLLTSFGCDDELASRPDCDQINCGDHGSCEDGLCVCEPGWQPAADGQSCEAFIIDPCEGFDCSDLGQCEIVPTGPYDIPKPICICDNGAWPSEDGLDCVNPCADFNCEPGVCVAVLGMGVCDCPIEYEPTIDGLACQERETYQFDLIYEVEGEQYNLGHAWVREHPADAGSLIETTTSYSIPASWEGMVGGLLRNSARFDEQGRLTEFVQDQQIQFIHVSARRRLRYVAEEAEDGSGWILHFDYNVLDRLWHGELPIEQLPLPMADGYEYPTFSYGCFDVGFYFLMGKIIDFENPPERIPVLYPSFVLPNSELVQVTGGTEIGQVSLPGRDTTATFENGLLTGVNYPWVSWRPTSGGSSLEFNLQPLPNTPLDHSSPIPPPWQDEAASLSSADGTVLHGALALPMEGEPARRALLFVPNLFPDHRDRGIVYNRTQRDMAAHLAAAGYASLRVDDRGVGESEGESTVAVERLSEDLQAAYDFLLTDQRFDSVVLLAQGMAAINALELAKARNPDALMMLGPGGSDLPADLYHTLTATMLLAGFREEEAANNLQGYRDFLAGYEDGSLTEDYHGRSAAWWQEMLGRDLLDCTGLTTLPVLLARGEEDMVLPADALDFLQNRLGELGCALTLLSWPMTSHALTLGDRDLLWERVHLPMPIKEEVLADIVTWLDELDSNRQGGAR